MDLAIPMVENSSDVDQRRICPWLAMCRPLTAWRWRSPSRPPSGHRWPHRRRRRFPTRHGQFTTRTGTSLTQVCRRRSCCSRRWFSLWSASCSPGSAGPPRRQTMH